MDEERGYAHDVFMGKTAKWACEIMTGGGQVHTRE